MANGYFILARKLFDGFLWQEERSLSKFEAFLYLLYNAQYSKETKKVLLKNNILTQNRGELLKSQRRLAQDWGWGTKTVRKFLKLLEKNGTIMVKTETVTTRITILNYEVYQDTKAYLDLTPDHAKETDGTRKGNGATYERSKESKEINEMKEKNLLSEFEKFWEMYEKKNDRKKAFQKWQKLKQEDKDKIFKTLPKYVKSTPNVKFRKNPTTYLNNESWKDDIVYRENKNKQSDKTNIYDCL